MPEDDKPSRCEWSLCQEAPKVKVILDNEPYWFCGHDHADEFRDYIMQSGNY